MSTTYRIDVEGFKSGSYEGNIRITRSEAELLSKTVPISVNFSAGTDGYIRLGAFYNTSGMAPTMANIYPGIYRTMIEIPDTLISEESHFNYPYRAMFKDCENLKSIGLESFTTLNVSNTQETGLGEMFKNCKSVETLNITSFSMSGTMGTLAYTDSMFEGCISLKTVNMTGLDTSQIKYMDNMFKDCGNLETITGTIDMAGITSYENMFQGCVKLTGLQIKNPPADFEARTGLSSSQYMVI